MIVRRFLVWLVEKAIELHLAILVLVLARIFMPVVADGFSGFQDVTDAWQGWIDDAAYQVTTFMDGSWPRFLWRTYCDAAFSVIFYGYFGSLYIFMSLLAGLLATGTHVRMALVAYVAAFAVFCWRFVHTFDSDMRLMLVSLFLCGLLVVALSAAVGAKLSGDKPVGASGARRIRLDFAD